MDITHLPRTITGPAAWLGPDMAQDERHWLYHLSPDDIAELENAARHYLALRRDVGEITAPDFPLPALAGHLKTLQAKLLHGNGIEVLRGLPVAGYSQEFAATVFCGIGAHLGSARSQNAAGHILGHVRDLGASSRDPNTSSSINSENACPARSAIICEMASRNTRLHRSSSPPEITGLGSPSSRTTSA